MIGLVGGIAAGKSAVARALARHWRILTLDADQSGHRALHDAEIRRRLVERFGERILGADGEVNRKTLAREVFGPTPEHQRNRSDLERIVHPWIRADLEAQLREARAAPQVDVILLDAPVLLESGWDEICDTVAFIDTPLEERAARAATRGWSLEELQMREKSQLPLDEKRRRSSFVVDNAGSVEAAAGQFAEELRQRFALPADTR
ncbi:dephospho-CoA kinase [Planctomyces sp. SH-PL14]|uniref:dephospho-CoA kinase n=1 Tax=Planctomyces sp. SH-PL14 TaxID=1632864 RepID=UPI00078CCE9A|nr:dephospho-CoA kinase [Planctomyces sp. SH-PL14]AMV17148.1 Dephospho-CoA kinase [Planctomyces sp. SH-PL14]